jgi:hypothetical protein
VGNSSFTSLTLADALSLDARSARRLVQRSNVLERLEPEECISAYSVDFQTKYGSVVLISSNFTASDTRIDLLGSQPVPVPRESFTPWVCSCATSCSSALARVRDGADWVTGAYTIDYCLAESTPGKCTLEYSLPLAIVVICANMVKTVLIGLAVLLVRGNPLLTVGDAVASFLRSPDDTTLGSCLLPSRMVVFSRRDDARGQWRSVSYQDGPDKPGVYTARPRRWMTAVSGVAGQSFSWCA